MQILVYIFQNIVYLHLQKNRAWLYINLEQLMKMTMI